MACLTISQKSGLGSVKEIVNLVRELEPLLSDIRVFPSGTVKFYSDYFYNIPDQLKWGTKGVKYDPSNGKYWAPKRTVKKQHTLARWD